MDIIGALFLNILGFQVPMDIIDAVFLKNKDYKVTQKAFGARLSETWRS